MANVSLRQASARNRRDRLSVMLRGDIPISFYDQTDRTGLAAPLVSGSSTPVEGRQRDLAAIRALIFADKTWYLLIVMILGFIAGIVKASPGLVFALNFIGLIPLARILGDATEEVSAAIKSGTIGGLLNATFGNAVEMILTIQTIRAGLTTVTKGTLLGSILSNLLLVLGMSLFFGGLGAKGKEQTFNESGPLANMTMLLLAALAFTVPTVVAQDSDISVVVSVSRFASIFTLIGYFAFLFFQLYTHKEMFEDEGDDEGNGATMSLQASCLLLLVSTLLTVVGSQFLVSCIEDVVVDYGISQMFIGVILLPIIGNACEHASAVRMAIHNKPILSIGIAVGSSTQIAMFLIPLSVLYGWMVGVPMDLNFKLLNALIFVLSVLIVTVILLDGKSQWLEGFMLQMTYCVIACAYWFDDKGM
jgi:Ca2+:H+ antiporter